MDFQDWLMCGCCDWEGCSDDLVEPDTCPDCCQSGSLQTDG